jgi:hypothetical protein
MPRRLDDGSRMSREVHVRFCEGLGLKCPGLLTRTSFFPPCRLRHRSGELCGAQILSNLFSFSG